VEVVDINGLRIAFERLGHGPPLLLLHGFVGDGPSTWRHQLDVLSDAYTVVAWDAPGAGNSSAVPASFRLPEYADCLAGFVAALDLERPSVAGLSFGGALAIELFRRHRGLVRKLVLASAYAGWAGSLPVDVVHERQRVSLELSRLPPAEFTAAMLPSMFSAAAPSDDRTAQFAASVAAFDPHGFRTMVAALAAADLREVLPEIDVPTLVLFGDQDVRAPWQIAESLWKSIPGARLVTLTGAGHISCVEDPDRFTAELRAFLDEPIPSPVRHT
jgi:pimeloyl-ACP methyl ester carboxylesterase